MYSTSLVHLADCTSISRTHPWPTFNYVNWFDDDRLSGLSSHASAAPTNYDLAMKGSGLKPIALEPIHALAVAVEALARSTYVIQSTG